jgi:pyruvate/2-oxoglutarate dehydrogenase complex dihydrolipoamide dehydrogenase (E3) component
VGVAGEEGFMNERLRADLCVIGAGSGGLSVAAAAAQLGAKVVLIEKARMGGDCLWSGCVPSKSLIAAANSAHRMRITQPFGVTPATPSVNLKAVAAHIQGVIQAIEPNDSVARFTGLGVKVVQAPGRFIDPSTVEAGDYRITARRFVIATGSTPVIPPILGLDTVPYHTNETIFSQAERIEHLVIIGGGPIGIELAQAHLRLGARVTVLEAMKVLGRDDAELTEPLIERLRQEGLVIGQGVMVDAIAPREGGGIRISVSASGESDVLDASHLLVATGRQPCTDGLGLDEAGIKFDRTGIKVSSGLVTSNKKVFAIGDVTGGAQFTHVANYHAGIVIRRALFRLPAKVDPGVIPWVTFTDPELAHVGLREEDARKRYGNRLTVLRWPYAENDRAQAEHVTEGFLKVITTRDGRILGASILGAEAGELIQMWSLAISAGLNIKAMAQYVAPYPTLSEINRRAATTFFAAKIGSPWVKLALRLLGGIRGR